MFFRKWFGKSTKRTAPQPAYQRPAVRPFDPKKVVAPNFELVDKAPETPRQPQQPSSQQGFDPYNTGSFDKRNTWKRIPRL